MIRRPRRGAPHFAADRPALQVRTRLLLGLVAAHVDAAGDTLDLAAPLAELRSKDAVGRRQGSIDQPCSLHARVAAAKLK